VDAAARRPPGAAASLGGGGSMKPTCPRLFEAEAWRDGRLTGVEAEKFRAHVSTCPSCSHEVQRLDALGRALRASVPASPDELHVRRERTRLLAAFDAQLVPVPRQANVKRWLALGIAVLACVAMLVALRSPAPKPAAVIPPAPAAAEPVVVHADNGAQWSRQAENQRETIRLQSGALSIHVDHRASPRRLLVLLPDGELEDIGTTFSVSADAGQTTHVSVEEGSVVLRLQGRPPLALAAGDSWHPPAPSVPPASATPPPATRSTKTVASPAPVPSTSTPAPDSAEEFRDAMAAFNRGDNSQAAALFRGFVVAHPRDSRTEDACYLRVLALQRTGNANATQDAAADYLRRYPGGFRKAEIERLAQPTRSN